MGDRQVCEWILNTLHVPGKLRVCLLLQGGEKHSCRDTKVERTFLSLFHSVEKMWAGDQQCARCYIDAFTGHPKGSPSQLRGRVHCAGEKTGNQGAEFGLRLLH